MDTTQIVRQVDARGLVCPMPTIRLGQAIRKVEVGRLVEVWTDDPGSKQNMAAWCKNTGHELVEQSSDDSCFRYVVRRSR
ncbi:MAG TPA: sulfurtransferase TusA family protein [Actinomycetota bacterium]|nr:sulfurtransferase TusA family protein [Actinomycetota bacterium]